MRARILNSIVLVGFSVCLCGCTQEPIDEPPKEIEPPQIEDGVPPEQEEKDSDAEPLEEPAPTKIERRESDFDAGRVSNVMFVRLFADDFPALENRPRSLPYHRARAGLASRECTYDLLHRDNLEVRHVIECIQRANVILDPEIEADLSDYLKRLWIHGGFYDSLTGRKFVPGFSFEQLEQAAGAARAVGADLDLRKGEPLEAKLSRLKKIIFDPD